MREVTNSNNIGSIITMLIDEQHVNIEDILTEEQYRQDCQHQNQVTSGPRKYFLIFCYKQTKIKEEVEPALADFSGNSFQDFNFGVQQGQQDNVWAGPVSDLHTNLQPGMEKEGETGKLIFSHNVLFRIC